MSRGRAQENHRTQAFVAAAPTWASLGLPGLRGGARGAVGSRDPIHSLPLPPYTHISLQYHPQSRAMPREHAAIAVGGFTSSPSGTALIVKAFQSKPGQNSSTWHRLPVASTVAGCHSEHSCRRQVNRGKERGLGRVGLAACGSLGGSGGSDACQEGARNEASAQHTKPLFMRVLYTPRHMSLFTPKTLWFYPLTGQLCAQQLLAPDIVIHLRGEG